MSQNFSQQPLPMQNQQQPMPVPMPAPQGQPQPASLGMPQQRMPGFPPMGGVGGPMPQPQAILEHLLTPQQVRPPPRRDGPHPPRVKRPSVYVGNLPQNFYDLDLFKCFTSRGFKLCRATVASDKVTKKTLRYGFLQFYTQEEAERCQKEMNNVTISGSQLNLSVQTNKEFDPKANVIVRNLGPEVTQQQIFDHFSTIGKIRSCKLELYPDGKSRGFAYILFEKAEEAEKAIAENGVAVLGGKKIEVFAHEKREKRVEAGTQSKFTNLYVQGLPAGTDEGKLKAMFASYGEIQSTHIPPQATNFGFVSFKEPADAASAMKEMNKSRLENGSYLLVSQHISKRDNDLAKNSSNTPIQQIMQKNFDSNLFVKNVPKNTPEQELREKFEQCGQIMSIKLRESAGGYFGPSAYHQYFILFQDVESAKAAIRRFDQSQEFGGKPLQVEFWVSRQELLAEREQRSKQEVSEWINSQNIQQNNYHQQQQMAAGAMPGANNYMNQQNRGNYNNQRGGRGGKPRGGANQRGAPYQGHRMQQQPHAMQQPAFGQPRPQAGFPAQQPVIDQVPVQQQQQPATPKIPEIQMPDINQTELASVTDINTRKQTIGNAIYPCIQAALGDVAGKITGMLLDENVVDINRLVTDQVYLNYNAGEALKLLENASQVPTPQAATQ